MVTGAASGIGRALALALADAGARLALADLQPDPLGETAAAVSTRGAACFAQPVDISNEDQIGEFVELAQEHLGPIELLANVAGMFIAFPFTELSEERLGPKHRRQSYWYVPVLRAVLPGMLVRRYGKIVNFGVRTLSHRCVRRCGLRRVQGGIVSFTRSLAKEVAAVGSKSTWWRRTPAARPARHAGGGRCRHHVSTFRRGGLCDWPGTPRRWRLHHAASRSDRFLSLA
jgi:NAD(P)-dependent dehydrogenase (short-subunit alcohol dehydrogenase family)